MRIAIRAMIALVLLVTISMTGLPLLNATLAAVAPIIVLDSPDSDGEPLVLNEVAPVERRDFAALADDPFFIGPEEVDVPQRPAGEALSVAQELEALRRLKEPDQDQVRQVAPEGMLEWPKPAGPLTRVPGREPPLETKSDEPTWRPISRPLIAVPGQLTSGELTVKLAGIEPPPLDHMCPDDRPCGRQARTALRMLVRGRTVECALDPNITEGEHEARCRLARTDLAGWLAAHGWAIKAEGDYAPRLADAREKGVGLYR